MATSACLPIAADRAGPCVRTIFFEGLDLTGVTLAMELRLNPETPGPASIALGMGATANAEGLRLVGVSNTSGVPTSQVVLRINETTMKDASKVPYSGELGSASTLAYDLIGIFGQDKRRLMYGSFTALPTVYGMDNAPANRPAGSGAAAADGGSSSATLQFGDQVIRVSIDGAEVIKQAAETVRAVASQAEVSAVVAETLSGAVVGLPVGDNPNELTARGGAPASNANFDVLLIRTNTGETWLTIGGLRRRITDGGGVAIPPGGLAAGMIITLNASPGGVFVLVGSRSLPGSPATIAAINTRISTVASVAEILAGAPIAYAVSGNVNELVVGGAAPAVNASFDTLLSATNTGETYATVGGVRLRVTDGGGVSIPAGGLLAGTIVTLARSPGGAFVLTGSRTPGPVKAPVGIDDPAIRDQPWGAVSFNGGSRSIQPAQVYVTVVGSSNAAAGYMPANLEPASVAAQTLNDYFISDGIQFVADNQARAGAPMVDIPNQLAASAAFQAGKSRFVASFCWMNESRTIFYNSEGGILAERDALRAAIPKIRAKGAEPVLVTGFHPDPRAIATALDANWFSDTRAYGAGGSTRDMHYPAFKASPVNPETDMVPPASAMTMIRDWSGSGIARTGSVRVWHVNNLIRRVAAEFGCVLLDFERLSFRKTIETVPDLSSGLDTWYNKSDPLHPKAAMYEQVISPLIAQWAYEMARGNTARRVFDGL